MFWRKPKNFSAMEQYLIKTDAETVSAKLRLTHTIWESYDSSIPKVSYDVCNHDGNIFKMRLYLKAYGCNRIIGVDKLVKHDRISKKLFELAETDFKNHIERLQTVGINVESKIETPNFTFLEKGCLK